jgi:indolepyruvate ferredoxin oxidoreductase beta subunit
MSEEKIPPTELTAKMMPYPSLKEVEEKIYSFTKSLLIVDAPKLAKKAGSPLTQNVVLLGVLAATEKVPIRTESLLDAIRELIPAKYLEINVKAFKLGYEFVKKAAFKS